MHAYAGTPLQQIYHPVSVQFKERVTDSDMKPFDSEFNVRTRAMNAITILREV